MKNKRKNQAVMTAAAGAFLVLAILVFGTVWTGKSAQRDTVGAARSVSLLFLDELAGRREQVVEDNLRDNINIIHIAVGMISSAWNVSHLSMRTDWSIRRTRGSRMICSGILSGPER